MIFLDVAAKKALRQEKLPMHTHDVTANETADTLIAVGHHKIAMFEMKA